MSVSYRSAWNVISTAAPATSSVPGVQCSWLIKALPPCITAFHAAEAVCGAVSQIMWHYFWSINRRHAAQQRRRTGADSSVYQTPRRCFWRQWCSRVGGNHSTLDSGLLHSLPSPAWWMNKCMRIGVRGYLLLSHNCPVEAERWLSTTVPRYHDYVWQHITSPVNHSSTKHCILTIMLTHETSSMSEHSARKRVSK